MSVEGPGGTRIPTVQTPRLGMRDCGKHETGLTLDQLLALLIDSCIGQEWTLYKVFDAKEEINDEEEDLEFLFSHETEVNGAGSRGMALLGLQVFES